MDVAQDAVLLKGFEATSIDEIVAAVEISKGGFFYHFADKNALAQALIRRYIEEEDRIFDDLFGRARELNDDPLHAMLIGLKMLAELFENLPQAHPGCLVATTAYQDRMFNTEVRELNRSAILGWRARFLAMIEDIRALYPPNEPVDMGALADMVMGVAEGGIVLSKALNEPSALPAQIMLFRTYLKLLFSPRLRPAL
ncbi:TetR family transcriptional regulator [Mesorhizobium sanjuanii]|uniref:TetR family transcriptional regulator n=2 Tax=Mesorhizobium sanjuanii TaxID=2037900 RepID=A0A2A6FFQ8_9HYPH|nr:TetR family transcriptional regulator [Mesorhizobium sanjuanii]